MTRNVAEMVLPRPMRPDEDEAVRALYAGGHPGWPDRAPLWFFAHPTLVLRTSDDLVGFCSFSLSSLMGAVTLQGQDLVVAPAWRNQGLGLALHLARLQIGREVGATSFCGFTTRDNIAMQRIFVACGHHACQTVARYYPDGQDALMYLGTMEA